MGANDNSPHRNQKSGHTKARPQAGKATRTSEASDERLDEALDESFPASDPPSECQPSPSPYDKDET